MTDEPQKPDLEPTPIVSIVIVNWNGKDFIDRCLNSVLKTRGPKYEVVVVDNASTDGSDDLVERVCACDNRVKLIRVGSNAGFSGGNNIGASFSSGKYIVLLNPDTEVERNWLSPLLEAADSMDGCIIQSKLRIMNSDLLDGLGDFPTIHGISLMLGHNQGCEIPSSYEIFSARAAAMMVRKDTFLALGGFDPDFFNGYEDVDFGWRHRLAGGKAILVKHSVVYHTGRVFTKRAGSREFFHKHKNSIATVIKNYSLRKVLAITPATIIIRTLISSAPNTDLRGMMGSTFSAIAATFWVLGHFRSIWKKHLFVQLHVRRVSDAEIQQHMLPSSFYVDVLRWVFAREGRGRFWDFLFRSMLKYVPR